MSLRDVLIEHDDGTVTWLRLPTDERDRHRSQQQSEADEQTQEQECHEDLDNRARSRTAHRPGDEPLLVSAEVGKVIGYLAERVRQWRMVLQTHERFLALFEQLRDGMCTLDEARQQCCEVAGVTSVESHLQTTHAVDPAVQHMIEHAGNVAVELIDALIHDQQEAIRAQKGTAAQTTQSANPASVAMEDERE